MGYAVELYFDTVGEERIRRLWEALAMEGITSTLSSLGARPHISLALFEEIDPAVLRDEIRDFAAGMPRITLHLSAVGVFPTAEGIVFAMPTATRELLDAHQEFHDRLKARGIKSNPYYLPGHWAPHCTLATELLADQIGTAVGACLRSAIFGEIELVEIGLIAYRPVERLFSFSLGDR